MTILTTILAAQNAIDRFFLPPSASNLAKDVDTAWNWILGISTFFFIVVVGSMTYFVIRYRRRAPNQQTSTITHNTPLEIIWTGVPLLLVITIFFVGFKGFLNLDTPQSNAVPIDVQASKWQFSFTYPNGAADANLHLMKGVPYVLNIQSKDVLHAVYIPAFRVQRNAVPGRTTQLWFIPEMASPPKLGTDEGGFDLFCTQYCGEQHSKMFCKVHVYDSQDAYDKKMTELANPFKQEKDGQVRWIPYAEVGKKFYTTYCAQCHSVDGSKSTGPTWKGLWKKNEAQQFAVSNEPGSTLGPGDDDAKWEAYISDSIMHPERKIVSGYQNQMPSFAGQFSGTPIKNENRRAIIEFIKSIGTPAYSPAVSPDKNADLFDAKANPDRHPEALKADTQPAPK